MKAAPQLGLDEVLKSLVPSNYTVDTVIVSVPPFFGNISAVLDKTPKETLQSFFLWRLIVSRINSVEGPEVQPYIKFTRRLGGRVSGSPHRPWSTSRFWGSPWVSTCPASWY